MKTKILLSFLAIILSGVILYTQFASADQRRFQYVSNSSAHDNWSNEDMLNEMRTTILNDTLLEKEYEKDKKVNYYRSEVNDELKTFLKNKVLKKIRRKNIAFVRYPFFIFALFSRCPTGYHVEIIKKNSELTNEGWMSASWGCQTKIISKFRYEIKTGMVEAKVSDNIGYIPMDEFVRLYKDANKGLRKSS